MNREIVSKSILKTLEAVFNVNPSQGDENIKHSVKLLAYIISKNADYKKALMSVGEFHEKDLETSSRFLTLGAKVVSELAQMVENYSNENKWHSFVFEVMARHEKYHVTSDHFEAFVHHVRDFVYENTVVEEDARRAWDQLCTDFCEQTRMQLALLGLKDRVKHNQNGVPKPS
ncbi:unnamed protein product, partial [Mesorhabditis belari]|uniref:Globin domain-containing protein n=1 Tax=Mesorhabditis belari TaxID=2138241 RepID=A0AAF3FHE1_9BILA